MNTFVIIFHQNPRQLTDAEKQRRAAETAAWAQRVNADGHKLEPRILTSENAQRGADYPAASKPDTWQITALLFLEARDLNEAAQIAESHPAVKYGSHVEIRPWAPPTPAVSSKP